MLAKRHFEIIYKTLITKSADERMCYFLLITFVKKSDKLVSLSFNVAKSIAVRGKSFSEGNFIKMSWLDCADDLFHDFDSKKIQLYSVVLSISRNKFIKKRI